MSLIKGPLINSHPCSLNHVGNVDYSSCDKHGKMVENGKTRAITLGLKSQLNNPEPTKLHVVCSPKQWTDIDTNKPVSFSVSLTTETVQSKPCPDGSSIPARSAIVPVSRHSREEPSDCRLLRN